MDARVPFRRLACAAGLSVAAAGCATNPTGRAAEVVRADTTFYVSTRARQYGRDTRRLADSLEYGLVVTARSPAEDPLTDRELRFQLVDSLRLTRTEFVAAVRSRAAGSEFAVLYTHGFGTSLHEGWEQAVHGRLRSQGDQPWIVFNWPASDRWLTWPKNGSLLAASYRQDSAAATASRPAFLAAFAAVEEAVGSDRMLLFTHSLGVQVVAEALALDEATRESLSARPVLGMAFHAADIEASRFTEVIVPADRALTKRLVLYASSDDRALGLAQRVSKTRRAGRIRRSGELPVTHPALESIDATSGASAEGFFRRLLGARHGVRHATATLFDLVHVVGGGRAVECREAVGTAERVAPTAWRFRAATLPTPAGVRACPAHQGTAEVERDPDGSTSATSPGAAVSPAPRATRR